MSIKHALLFLLLILSAYSKADQLPLTDSIEHVLNESPHAQQAPMPTHTLAHAPKAECQQQIMPSFVGGNMIGVLAYLFLDWALTNAETRKAAVPLHIAAAGFSLICYLGHFGKFSPQTPTERKASACGAITSLFIYCFFRSFYFR